MTELKRVDDTSIFEEFNKGSYYTIIGCAGDIEKEWIPPLIKYLLEEGIGTPKEFYTFTGKQMNDYYHLTRNNRYKDDLVFLSFPLEGLNTGRLAVLRLRRDDKWFDDIVSNNAMREEYRD